MTFAISMFLLVMQFFWKYIDDLMGKGISVMVIVELLFYVSASLIPLALPLAILLSSIMTFGNLSENNELTALKSSGLSLYRIIRPLAGVAVMIAIATFFFANYVIPVANLKWHSLIFDIQNTKISTIITPGAYSKELDGYAIKVDKGTESEFTGILIHDHTIPNEITTIRAKEGKIYKSENGKYLFFELKDGVRMQELEPQSPTVSPDGVMHSPNGDHPSQRSSFEQATIKIDLTGFDLNRSREELFKDKHEMLNVLQINYITDSIEKSGHRMMMNFVMNVKNDHPYFMAHSYEHGSRKSPQIGAEEGVEIPDTIINFQDLTKKQKITAINLAQSKLRTKNKNLETQAQFLTAIEKDMDRYLLEFHRKFALASAIIILFFVGAPLGAIIRKGGFGAPVVIAALLFMVYFVLLTVGDNLVQSGNVTPFVGMWFPSLVLAPIAVWFMRAAAKDVSLFTFPFSLKFLKRKA